MSQNETYILDTPPGGGSPFILSSPHSGRYYPDSFKRLSRLDEKNLRRSEDCFVDELFGSAPKAGAYLLKAVYPRAYVDLNRDSNELDPVLIADPLPYDANSGSERVAAGLGTVARVVATGMPIYAGQLSLKDVRHRIETIYSPYHQCLNTLLKKARDRYGWSALIDCHSMPSYGQRGQNTRAFNKQNSEVDFVLGDRFGKSCDPRLTDLAEEVLNDMGYRVRRNHPYAGGFCTQNHGRPATGRHALQIEINRALYLDEATLAKTDRFSKLQHDLERFIRRLVNLDLSANTQLAAE